jgi:hypothetical protein
LFGRIGTWSDVAAISDSGKVRVGITFSRISVAEAVVVGGDVSVVANGTRGDDVAGQNP